MKKIPKRIVAANSLGAAGYSLILASWALFLAVVLLLLADSSAIIVPTEVSQAAAPEITADVSGFARLMSYALAVVATLVTLGIFVTLPYFVGKYFSKGLRWLLLAVNVMPTLRSMFVVKILFLMIPAIGFFAMNMALQPVSMTFAAISIAAFFATMLAVTLFSLQLFVARYLRVNDKSIW